MSRVDTVVFQGAKFRRYPDSTHQADQRYYSPGIADRQRGIRRLHEEVWIAAHGPIPSGHHVHHRDHNHLNNELDNLECISDDEHRAHHTADRHTSGFYRRPEQLEHLERIREQAAEWHRSDIGRAWHSEHGRRTWDNRESDEHTCQQCGVVYRTRSRRGHERFCTNACKAAWRRVSGVDDEDRSCEHCGTPFRINRYSKTRCCSRSCSSRLGKTKT